MLLRDPLGGPFQARFLLVWADALIELLRKPLPGRAEVAGNGLRVEGISGSGLWKRLRKAKESFRRRFGRPPGEGE